MGYTQSTGVPALSQALRPWSASYLLTQGSRLCDGECAQDQHLGTKRLKIGQREELKYSAVATQGLKQSDGELG